MDSTVMHINKGNALSWGNPKGTHTERKGNAVMRIKNNIIYYLFVLYEVQLDTKNSYWTL